MSHEIVMVEVRDGSFEALRTASRLSEWQLFISTGANDESTITQALGMLRSTCARCPVRDSCNPITNFTDRSLSHHGLNTGSPSCAIPKTVDGSLKISW